MNEKGEKMSVYLPVSKKSEWRAWGEIKAFPWWNQPNNKRIIIRWIKIRWLNCSIFVQIGFILKFGQNAHTPVGPFLHSALQFASELKFVDIFTYVYV